MTRRTVIARLAALAAAPLQSPLTPPAGLTKYYIHGGTLTTDGVPRDDCAVPALVAFGRTPEEALLASGQIVEDPLAYMRDGARATAACRSHRR